MATYGTIWPCQNSGKGEIIRRDHSQIHGGTMFREKESSTFLFSQNISRQWSERGPGFEYTTAQKL